MNFYILFNKKYFSIILIILVFILTLCISLSLLTFNKLKILPNVFINDIKVGGLTPREAKLKVEEELKKQLDNFLIQLVYDDKLWNLNYKDIDLHYFIDDSIDEAYKVAREDNYLHRIKIALNLRKNPQIIKLRPSYNLLKIEDKLDEISQTIDKGPVNAKIERRNGNFIITKETLGIETKKEALEYKIVDNINKLKNTLINIEVRNIEPRILLEDLKSVEDLIGHSITIFNNEDKGRTENIKIAVDVIDNRVLMPGEEFSFNDSTGPRSADAGYKDASVIVNGEFVIGIGGGICQVSTTLYQAALKSDLQITSRKNHGLPVGYVPMGQDATVAYDYIDFKFKNNKEYPIYIESFIKGQELHVKLYSKKINNIDIRLESEIIEVIEAKIQIKKDPNMYLSEKKVSKNGKKGYRTRTYKIYLQEGKELKREMISKDYYPPREGLIIEGTKEENFKEFEEFQTTIE